ncbi:hypothetical protein, partial [Pseudomonas syringae]|uniref:hypothetical protein n=1 Tax=Pseudomonas syringae TaxID=317 RepID=UPI001F2303C1
FLRNQNDERSAIAKVQVRYGDCESGRLADTPCRGSAFVAAHSTKAACGKTTFSVSLTTLDTALANGTYQKARKSFGGTHQNREIRKVLTTRQLAQMSFERCASGWTSLSLICGNKQLQHVGLI